MAAWRMAMRGRYDDGRKIDPPVEMWHQCRALGVAAISYDAVQDDNFTEYARTNPPNGWKELAYWQQRALEYFIHEMKIGDVIYVKQGTQIVGRGVISGNYYFDSHGRIHNEYGKIWRHQRPVGWCRDFERRDVKIGSTQQPTIVPLTDDDIMRVELSFSR